MSQSGKSGRPIQPRNTAHRWALFCIYKIIQNYKYCQPMQYRHDWRVNETIFTFYFREMLLIDNQLDGLELIAPDELLCGECFEKKATWKCYACGPPGQPTPAYYCDGHRDSKWRFGYQSSTYTFQIHPNMIARKRKRTGSFSTSW